MATQESPGHFVAAGVYIDTGTRYEDDETVGASHILDRMSFKVSIFAVFVLLILPAKIEICELVQANIIEH